METAWSNKNDAPAGNKQNFYANEVCYGLAIAAQLGLSGQDAIDYVLDDLKKWSKKALPKGKEEIETEKLFSLANQIEQAAKLQNPTNALFRIAKELRELVK